MKKLAAMLFLLVTTGTLHAAVPTAIHYQGYLSDVDGTPVSGDYSLVFKLFAQQTGGNAVFTESRDVKVDLGAFTVVLGLKTDNPVTPQMLSGGDVWLELAVGIKGATPVTLSPRQRVVSHPFAMHALDAEQCRVADNALSFGGVAPQAYVTVASLPDLCITDGELPGKLLELGIAAYGDKNVAAYLLANGYKPGGSSSVQWEAILGKPAGLLTEESAADSGIFLLADGSVVATGDLDLGGNELLNFVVQKSGSALPPENPVEGQLWYDTDKDSLKVYSGKLWTSMGSASALDCEGCVDDKDISFNYASATTKGGAAANAANLQCTGCVEAAELSISWALGKTPGGAAANLDCVGCVTLGHLATGLMSAGNVAYDDTVSAMGTTSVGAAVQKLDQRVDALEKQSPLAFNEGNGVAVPYVDQWEVPPYGKATTYVHLMNPAKPKVISWLYGGERTAISGTDNLTLGYALKPNKYAGITTANAGEKTMVVDTPSNFAEGNHVLLYQIVKASNVPAGTWEINRVTGIQGNTIMLGTALKNTYVSTGDDTGWAQAVVAASYDTLDVVGGGNLAPASTLSANTEKRGGILYVRARKITVRSGGKITADANGFEPGDWDYGDDYYSERGHSECSVKENTNNYGRDANCSGGGAGYRACCTPTGYASGGGGNRTAGANGNGSNNGYGGSAKGDALGNTLHFGGGGGRAWPYSGGMGGGIVVIGAETLIVETGGIISANGNAGTADTSGSYSYYGASGGGAGGTVAIFAQNYTNNGTVEAKGGNGGSSFNGKIGGNGGEGWVLKQNPIPGIVNEGFAKGVTISLDGKDITAALGDPNSQGSPSWDSVNKKWGADGLHQWATGPLDLSTATTWSLGEHRIDLTETGGSGGNLKLYTYIVYPFTSATTPANDTCAAPQTIDLSGGSATVSGTTEDSMGRIKATDDYVQATCGGSGGGDVVYRITLTQWKKLSFSVVSAFTPRMYLRKASCDAGQLMKCAERTMETDPLKPGDYYLFVDGDGNLQKGNFVLQAATLEPAAPSNDTCAAPLDLTFDASGKSEIYGMTLFSKDDYKACGDSGGADNVFRFTVPAGTKSVDIGLQCDFDTLMYLSKDACGGAYSCIPDKVYTMTYPVPGAYFLTLDGATAAAKGEYVITLQLK